LDEVAIFAEYPYVSSIFSSAKPNVGVRAALAVDMARIKPGPAPSAETCAKVRCALFDRILHFEDAIGSHACSLEALAMAFLSGIHYLFPVGTVILRSTSEGDHHQV
jgi:hypothetical protein